MTSLFSMPSPLSPQSQWALLINLLPCAAFKKRQRLLAHTQSLMAFLGEARDAFASTLTSQGQSLLQQIPYNPASSLHPADLCFHHNELGTIKNAIDRIERGILQENWNLLSFDDDDFPPLLKQISDPPLVLFVKGNTTSLHQPLLAVVGSRRASPQGLKDTFGFAQSLANAGIGICSGLALGVDAASHQGALSVANGVTVAVMATGLDVIYPARHRSLAESIDMSGGCLVTEYLPGTQALKFHFPQRNRLISGLSLGVLVMEAQEKSGSLLTARAAMDDNREVFAVPGSIHNPNAKGCHRLIQQGAHLVAQPEDIIAPLTAGWIKTSPLQTILRATPPSNRASPKKTSPTSQSETQPTQNNLFPETAEEDCSSNQQAISNEQPELSSEQQALLALIPNYPISVDQLVELTNKNTQWLMAQLLELELLDHLQQQDGLIYKQSKA